MCGFQDSGLRAYTLGPVELGATGIPAVADPVQESERDEKLKKNVIRIVLCFIVVILYYSILGPGAEVPLRGHSSTATPKPRFAGNLSIPPPTINNYSTNSLCVCQCIPCVCLASKPLSPKRLPKMKIKKTKDGWTSSPVPQLCEMCDFCIF